MNTLSQIAQFIETEIANGNAHKALAVAQAGIAAWNASPSASDGAKTQALANGLETALMPLIPALDPLVAGVVAVLEPMVGKVVDWTEMTFAGQADGVDDQSGPSKAPAA